MADGKKLSELFGELLARGSREDNAAEVESLERRSEELESVNTEKMCLDLMEKYQAQQRILAGDTTDTES